MHKLCLCPARAGHGGSYLGKSRGTQPTFKASLAYILRLKKTKEGSDTEVGEESGTQSASALCAPLQKQSINADGGGGAGGGGEERGQGDHAA